jgi:DNA-binding NarL/FixJ family response regulator
MYRDRQEEARAAGADLFVSKGESPERLLCAISSLL